MTDIERIKRTDSGNIRKDDAMKWLVERSIPTDEELLQAVIPQKYGSTGKTFHKPISDIRIKGDAEFVETVAGLFKSFEKLDMGKTRLSISLGKVKDKKTGAETDTWRLYLRAVERGTGRKPRTLDSIPEDRDAIV